jgi:hypothetical protein
MNTKHSLLLLAAATGLGGCDLWHAWRADKLDTTQEDALADLLAATGTTASVIADPGNASAGDLAEAMSFAPYVAFLRPDGTAAAPRLTAAPVAVPGCLVSEGSSVTATDCEVPVGGLTCRVNGSAGGTPEGAGTRYAGQFTMSGEGCPQRTVDLDFLLSGSTDSPTGFDGVVMFSENNPPNDVFSGTVTFAGLGFEGSCSVLSKGTLTVDIAGTAGGAAIDEELTISFNDSPECGVILIEN